jgi:putative chitinase
MADNTAFFNAVRSSLFGGKLSQSQVDGINAVIEAWERSGDKDDRKLAYLLAITFHETGRAMQPIYERGAKSYFDKYEPGTKIGKSLGNTNIGDGYRFRGRGYVQITGRFNYRNAGLKMDVDLLSSPDKALDPVIAGMALVRGSLEGWYTGKKLGDYINSSKTDYINARRVINGTDKATLIAGYADRFEHALATGVSASPAPKPSSIPTGGLPEPAKPDGINPAGVIVAALIAIAGAVYAFLKSQGILP